MSFSSIRPVRAKLALPDRGFVIPIDHDCITYAGSTCLWDRKDGLLGLQAFDLPVQVVPLSVPDLMFVRGQNDCLAPSSRVAQGKDLAGIAPRADDQHNQTTSDDG